VGFNLYCQLLATAVEKQKARQAGVPEEEIEPSRMPPPSIDLPLPAFIPEEYVSNLTTRLNLYQKMVELETAEEIEAMEQEFHDRFGLLPEEVKNLLYVIKIKALAGKAGVESILTEHGEIVLRMWEGMRFDREKLEPVMREGIRVGTTQLGLNLKRLGKEWREVLEGVIGNTT